MYFATQLFSLSVISGKNWLLDLGSMWQEMFFLIKTMLNQGIRAISFRKKLLIETVLSVDLLYAAVHF